MADKKYKINFFLEDGRTQSVEFEVPSGKDGRDGKDGATGPKGDTGDRGPVGPKGDKGDKGPKGDTGDRGPVGPKGDKGDKGPKGDTGERGADGSGATEEQLAQIEQNTNDITQLKSDFSELEVEVQALKENEVTDEDIANLGFWKETEGKAYVGAEIADVKALMVQQTPSFPVENDTLENALAWLETNGDTSKVYVLPDGYIYGYYKTKKAVGGYTNVIDINSDDFKSGQRYNASGAITTTNVVNAFVSNMFACKSGDIVRIRGIKKDSSTSSTAPIFGMARLLADGSNFNNAHCMYLGVPYTEPSVGQRAWNAYTTLDDGTIEYVFATNNNGVNMADDSGQSGGTAICNTRVCGVAIDGLENVIVTVNEEIVEPSIVEQYAWVSTGHAFVPSDYEGRIIEVEEQVEKNKQSILLINEALDGIGTGGASGARWFALGDSITEGWTSAVDSTADSGYKQYINTNVSERWVNIVAEKNGYELTNHGIGGTGYLHTNGTKLNARQLADTLDFSQCDFVTLAYGVNDWKNAQPIGTMDDDIETGGSMVANMRYVIKKILSDNPYCKIFVITPINCRSYGTYATNYGINYKGGTGGHLNSLGLQDIFDRMKEVCDYHGIEMIDMTHSSIVNRENIVTMLADYVHPTVECHKAMARELVKKINFT